VKDDQANSRRNSAANALQHERTEFSTLRQTSADSLRRERSLDDLGHETFSVVPLIAFAYDGVTSRTTPAFRSQAICSPLAFLPRAVPAYVRFRTKQLALRIGTLAGPAIYHPHSHFQRRR
jgi:hypothetical protein